LPSDSEAMKLGGQRGATPRGALLQKSEAPFSLNKKKKVTKPSDIVQTIRYFFRTPSTLIEKTLIKI